MSAVQILDWRWFAAMLALAVSCPSWAQQSTATADPPRVAAATLKRTRIVAPAMPQVARDNGLSGFVELNFTIQPDGSVTDVQVVNAEPLGLFEASAIKALSQWRYEPVLLNGEPVAKLAMIRMKFAQEPPIGPVPATAEPAFKQAQPK
jgi:TonB family protein